MSKPKPTSEQRARQAQVFRDLMLMHDPPLDDTSAAALMGVDRGQWRRWANGEHSPSIGTIERIAEAFDVDQRQLGANLAGSDVPSPTTLERIEASLIRVNERLDLLIQRLDVVDQEIGGDERSSQVGG